MKVSFYVRTSCEDETRQGTWLLYVFLSNHTLNSSLGVRKGTSNLGYFTLDPPRLEARKRVLCFFFFPHRVKRNDFAYWKIVSLWFLAINGQFYTIILSYFLPGATTEKPDWFNRDDQQSRIRYLFLFFFHDMANHVHPCLSAWYIMIYFEDSILHESGSVDMRSVLYVYRMRLKQNGKIKWSHQP